MKGQKKMSTFFKEVWRRRVLQVAIPYGIGGWVLVQVAEVILDAFEAPSWIMQGLLIVLVLGYPVAVILAWIFDITPNHNIVRTRPLEVPAEEPPVEETPAPSLSLEMGESQRRQVTILNCVFEFHQGSDPEADPESLRDAISSLKSITNRLSERYEAFALPAGAEELKLVFGYPLAREDDARRAVTAGLALLNEIKTIPELAPKPGTEGISARIGVSTGLVIVDESLADDQGVTFIGQAPRMAAWLRTLAEPNAVALGPITQKLIASHFQLEPLGTHNQAQFGGEVAVYLATASRATVHSFAGNLAQTGRKDEMRLLQDRWENVLDGDGQFVILQGEPGIGKSSLLGSFVQTVLEKGDASLVPCQCSPYELHNPLTPVTRMLQDTLLSFTEQDTAEERSQKLLSFLEQQPVEIEEAMPLMANLLSLDPGPRYSQPSESPQIVRMQTLELLLDMVSAAAKRKPVLLIIEDLHWADPSTLEMIRMMVDRGPAPGLFVLFSTRPGFNEDWTRRSYVLVQELQPLSRKDARQLVNDIEGGDRLPEPLVKRIIEETDGNPLFIQELTLAVLESEAWRDSLASGKPQDMRWLAIPATLQESLAARIDNLGAAKPLLQLCSVLGREFSYELLKAVSGTENESALKQELAEIVGAEMLYQRGVLKSLTYTFKHILIQETTYNSLLKSKRKELHGRTAEILEQESSGVGQTQPALLAYHYTEAGNLEKAVPYWTLASRQSLSRFALQEAIEQSRSGISLLASLPESAARAALETPLQSILGTALLSTYGYADPRVRKVFTRALALCEQIGDAPQLFKVAVGLWMYYLIAGQLDEAFDLSQRLQRIADTTDDPAQHLQARYCQAFVLYYRADFLTAKSHLETALKGELADYDYASQSASGDDTRIHVRVVLALINWHLGFVKTAVSQARDAIRIAREMKHPWGVTFATFFSTWLHQMRLDARETLRFAEDAAKIAQEKGFKFWLPLVTYMQAWANNRDAGQVSKPRDPAGVEQMKSSLDIYRGSGVGFGVTYLSVRLAEDYIALQMFDQAHEELEKCWEAMKNSGEVFFEPEYYRLHGRICAEIFRQTQEPEQLEKAGEFCLQALSLARRKETKALELRAANDHAEVMMQQGKQLEASNLLEGILRRFDETDGSEDFVRAGILLKKLKGSAAAS